MFCADCPYLPKGITAEVGAIRVNGNTRAAIGELTTVIVTSENPDITVGDAANEIIELEGKNPSEIRESIDSCTGPTTPGRVAAMLGAKGICNGVKIV